MSMDIHRLRIVDFDTPSCKVADGTSEKHTSNKFQEVESTDQLRYGDKMKADYLGAGDQNTVSDSIRASASRRSNFLKRRSSSEIFRVPSRTKLNKHKHKNTSSFEDLKKPFRNNKASNKKNRFNFFNRESILNLTLKSGDGKRHINRSKKKPAAGVLFGGITPDVSRSKQEGTTHGNEVTPETKIPNDIFGFQRCNRLANSRLYNMSCNYINLDNCAPFRKLRKGFRGKHVNKKPIEQPLHSRNLLCSRVKVLSSVTDLPIEGQSDNYNIRGELNELAGDSENVHLTLNATRTDGWGSYRPRVSFNKDKYLSTCSLVHKQKCCDAACGFSKETLAQSKENHRDTLYTNVKNANVSRSRESSRKSLNSPKRKTRKQANKKELIDRIVTSESKKMVTGLIQSVTAFHMKQTKTVCSKKCMKYIFLGLLIIVWSPCLLAIVLAWIVMCPLRLTVSGLSETLHESPVCGLESNAKKKSCVPECHRTDSTYMPRPQQKGFFSSVTNWYVRTTGTINDVLSMLKLTRHKPAPAGSSFVSHPNPKKIYNLYYAKGRGWVMKCLHNRKYQNMRCEYSTRMCPKANTAKDSILKPKSPARVTFTDCECPVHSCHTCLQTNKNECPPSSPSMLPDVNLPVSKTKVDSCYCVPPPLEKCDSSKQQVNIMPQQFDPRNGCSYNANSLHCKHQNLCAKANTDKEATISQCHCQNYVVAPLYRVLVGCPVRTTYSKQLEKNGPRKIDSKFFNTRKKHQSTSIDKILLNSRRTNTSHRVLSTPRHKISNRHANTAQQQTHKLLPDKFTPKIHKKTRLTKHFINQFVNDLKLESNCGGIVAHKEVNCTSSESTIRSTSNCMNCFQGKSNKSQSQIVKTPSPAHKSALFHKSSKFDVILPCEITVQQKPRLFEKTARCIYHTKQTTTPPSFKNVTEIAKPRKPFVSQLLGRMSTEEREPIKCQHPGTMLVEETFPKQITKNLCQTTQTSKTLSLKTDSQCPSQVIQTNMTLPFRKMVNVQSPCQTNINRIDSLLGKNTQCPIQTTRTDKYAPYQNMFKSSCVKTNERKATFLKKDSPCCSELIHTSRSQSFRRLHKSCNTLKQTNALLLKNKSQCRCQITPTDESVLNEDLPCPCQTTQNIASLTKNWSDFPCETIIQRRSRSLGRDCLCPCHKTSKSMISSIKNLTSSTHVTTKSRSRSLEKNCLCTCQMMQTSMSIMTPKYKNKSDSLYITTKQRTRSPLRTDSPLSCQTTQFSMLPLIKRLPNSPYGITKKKRYRLFKKSRPYSCQVPQTSKFSSFDNESNCPCMRSRQRKPFISQHPGGISARNGSTLNIAFQSPCQKTQSSLPLCFEKRTKLSHNKPPKQTQIPLFPKRSKHVQPMQTNTSQLFKDILSNLYKTLEQIRSLYLKNGSKSKKTKLLSPSEKLSSYQYLISQHPYEATEQNKSTHDTVKPIKTSIIQKTSSDIFRPVKTTTGSSLRKNVSTFTCKNKKQQTSRCPCNMEQEKHVEITEHPYNSKEKGKPKCACQTEKTFNDTKEPKKRPILDKVSECACESKITSTDTLVSKSIERPYNSTKQRKRSILDKMSEYNGKSKVKSLDLPVSKFIGQPNDSIEQRKVPTLDKASECVCQSERKKVSECECPVEETSISSLVPNIIDHPINSTEQKKRSTLDKTSEYNGQSKLKSLDRPVSKSTGHPYASGGQKKVSTLDKASECARQSERKKVSECECPVDETSISPLVPNIIDHPNKSTEHKKRSTLDKMTEYTGQSKIKSLDPSVSKSIKQANDSIEKRMVPTLEKASERGCLTEGKKVSECDCPIEKASNSPSYPNIIDHPFNSAERKKLSKFDKKSEYTQSKIKSLDPPLSKSIEHPYVSIQKRKVPTSDKGSECDCAIEKTSISPSVPNVIEHPYNSTEQKKRSILDKMSEYTGKSKTKSPHPRFSKSIKYPIEKAQTSDKASECACQSESEEVSECDCPIETNIIEHPYNSTEQRKDPILDKASESPCRSKIRSTGQSVPKSTEHPSTTKKQKKRSILNKISKYTGMSKANSPVPSVSKPIEHPYNSIKQRKGPTSDKATECACHSEKTSIDPTVPHTIEQPYNPVEQRQRSIFDKVSKYSDQCKVRSPDSSHSNIREHPFDSTKRRKIPNTAKASECACQSERTPVGRSVSKTMERPYNSVELKKRSLLDKVSKYTGISKIKPPNLSLSKSTQHPYRLTEQKKVPTIDKASESGCLPEKSPSASKFIKHPDNSVEQRERSLLNKVSEYTGKSKIKSRHPSVSKSTQHPHNSIEQRKTLQFDKASECTCESRIPKGRPVSDAIEHPYKTIDKKDRSTSDKMLEHTGLSKIKSSDPLATKPIEHPSNPIKQRKLTALDNISECTCLSKRTLPDPIVPKTIEQAYNSIEQIKRLTSDAVSECPCQPERISIGSSLSETNIYPYNTIKPRKLSTLRQGPECACHSRQKSIGTSVLKITKQANGVMHQENLTSLKNAAPSVSQYQQTLIDPSNILEQGKLLSPKKERKTKEIGISPSLENVYVCGCKSQQLNIGHSVENIVKRIRAILEQIMLPVYEKGSKFVQKIEEMNISSSFKKTSKCNCPIKQAIFTPLQRQKLVNSSEIMAQRKTSSLVNVSDYFRKIGQLLVRSMGIDVEDQIENTNSCTQSSKSSQYQRFSEGLIGLYSKNRNSLSKSINFQKSFGYHYNNKKSKSKCRMKNTHEYLFSKESIYCRQKQSSNQDHTSLKSTTSFRRIKQLSTSSQYVYSTESITSLTRAKSAPKKISPPESFKSYKHRNYLLKSRQNLSPQMMLPPIVPTPSSNKLPSLRNSRYSLKSLSTNKYPFFQISTITSDYESGSSDKLSSHHQRRKKQRRTFSKPLLRHSSSAPQFASKRILLYSLNNSRLQKKRKNNDVSKALLKRVKGSSSFIYPSESSKASMLKLQRSHKIWHLSYVPIFKRKSNQFCEKPVFRHKPKPFQRHPFLCSNQYSIRPELVKQFGFSEDNLNQNITVSQPYIERKATDTQKIGRNLALHEQDNKLVKKPLAGLSLSVEDQTETSQRLYDSRPRRNELVQPKIDINTKGDSLSMYPQRLSSQRKIDSQKPLVWPLMSSQRLSDDRPMLYQRPRSIDRRWSRKIPGHLSILPQRLQDVPEPYLGPSYQSIKRSQGSQAYEPRWSQGPKDNVPVRSLEQSNDLIKRSLAPQSYETRRSKKPPADPSIPPERPHGNISFRSIAPSNDPIKQSTGPQGYEPRRSTRPSVDPSMSPQRPQDYMPLRSIGPSNDLTKRSRAPQGYEPRRYTRPSGDPLMSSQRPQDNMPRRSIGPSNELTKRSLAPQGYKTRQSTRPPGDPSMSPQWPQDNIPKRSIGPSKNLTKRSIGTQVYEPRWSQRLSGKPPIPAKRPQYPVQSLGPLNHPIKCTLRSQCNKLRCEQRPCACRAIRSLKPSHHPSTRVITPSQPTTNKIKISSKSKKETKKKNKEKAMESRWSFYSCWLELKEAVKQIEESAWPFEFSCDRMYMIVMKNKPCFWLFKRCPSRYHDFLKFYNSCFCKCSLFILRGLVMCFWLPFLLCMYYCVKATICAGCN